VGDGPLPRMGGYPQGNSIIGGATLWWLKGAKPEEYKGVAQLFKYLASTENQALVGGRHRLPADLEQRGEGDGGIGPLRQASRPMTQPMYFVQGPKQVVMILTSFNDVRRIYLTDKHSENVKTSWYGESIGRYEGDTLVVDTIGLDDRTWVDGFGTPHTKQLHVIERWHRIDGGENLE